MNREVNNQMRYFILYIYIYASFVHPNSSVKLLIGWIFYPTIAQYIYVKEIHVNILQFKEINQSNWREIIQQKKNDKYSNTR